jgi:outer membrane protein assembly factor BamB
MAVDNSGEVVLGGPLKPGTDLGGGPVAGTARYDMPFVARFSATGDFLWQRVLSGAYGHVRAVAVSGERVYLSGNFIYRFTFAGQEYAKDISFAPFLGALDKQGRDVWMRTLGYTSADQDAQALAVDAGGNVVFTNRIGQPWSAGGGVLRAGRLVASYSASGAHRWSRTLSVNLWFSELTRLGNGELVLGSQMARGGTLEGEWYLPDSHNMVFLRLKP